MRLSEMGLMHEVKGFAIRIHEIERVVRVPFGGFGAADFLRKHRAHGGRELETVA